jgi:hypothetical protein
MVAKMTKKRVSGSIAHVGFETRELSISISNENGIHDHERNGEHFRGKQADCPLCENGSEFERSFGRIGA